MCDANGANCLVGCADNDQGQDTCWVGCQTGYTRSTTSNNPICISSYPSDVNKYVQASYMLRESADAPLIAVEPEAIAASPMQAPDTPLVRLSATMAYAPYLAKLASQTPMVSVLQLHRLARMAQSSVARAASALAAHPTLTASRRPVLPHRTA